MFRGILQLCNEPAHRVFIGPTPCEVALVREQTNKYIRALTVKMLDTTRADHWIDVALEFNHDLVGILGNKGRGKSVHWDLIQPEAHGGLLPLTVDDDPALLIHDWRPAKIVLPDRSRRIHELVLGGLRTRRALEGPEGRGHTLSGNRANSSS